MTGFSITFTCVPEAKGQRIITHENAAARFMLVELQARRKGRAGHKRDHKYGRKYDPRSGTDGFYSTDIFDK